MKNSTRKHGLVAAVTLALSMMSGAASAAPLADQPSVRVRYSDLDLAREDGVRVLYARIRAAARQVCADNGTRDLRRLAAARACYEASLARAVGAVDNDRLAALYSQKEGRMRSRRIAALTP